jgi:hypothetical protein
MGNDGLNGLFYPIDHPLHGTLGGFQIGEPKTMLVRGLLDEFTKWVSQKRS